jgi:hypothetical protein
VSRYAVLCGCDGTTQRIIAWIDDDRPGHDHVVVALNSAGSIRARAAQYNKRGGLISYSMRCDGCHANVTFSEATADELIDRIIPAAAGLECRPIPSLRQPDTRSDEQRSADIAHAKKLIEEQLYGRVQPLPSPPAPITPNATNFEMRRVIPFDMFLQIVSGLRDRRRTR